MSTELLGTAIRTAIDDYIDTLPDPKSGWDDAAQRLALTKAMYNAVEDMNRSSYQLTGLSYTIPDGLGHTVIYNPDQAGDATITLPLAANNLFRKISVINGDPTHKVNIIPNVADDFSIATDEFEIFKSTYPTPALEFIAIPGNIWKRTSRIFVPIPESERYNGWPLNSGSATTWTPVDFSSYLPRGTVSVVCNLIVRMNGNGSLDSIYCLFRIEGSAIADARTQRVGIYRTNLTSGHILGYEGDFNLQVNPDNLQFEYDWNSANADLWLNPTGYYI